MILKRENIDKFNDRGSGMNEDFPLGPAKGTKEWNLTKQVEYKVGQFLKENCRYSSPTDFVLNTIFTYFIEAVAEEIGNRSNMVSDDAKREMAKMSAGDTMEGFYVDFDHLFMVGSTIKVNEESEKIGNINLKILVHDDVPLCLDDFKELLVERQTESGRVYKVYQVEDEYQKKMIETCICENAARNLSQKCNILILDTDIITTIAMAFFVASIEVMLQTMSEENKTKMEFNIMEAFEIMIHVKGRPVPNTIQIKVCVGEAMKLNVKNDTTTEDD